MSTSDSSGDIYDETLAVFDRTDRPLEPLTTPEIADALGCARRTVYKRLATLADRGAVETKKVGSSARVWWRPTAESEPESDDCGTDRLRERERALRRAYGVIADRDLPFPAKVNALLSVVREAIGTDYATLSQVRGDEYHFEWIDAPYDPDLQAGDTTPLQGTICERVVATERTLVLREVEADAPELATRASSAEWGIACYLGAPVFVDGDVYGTFCFYDKEARDEQFSDWEVTFVELLSNWVSQELERQRHTDRLLALDELNGVVRRINDAVIERSTREEIERAVVDALADSDSYEFAWIGEVGPASKTVEARCEAGVEGYLDDATVPLDPDESDGAGPTARAASTQETQVVVDLQADHVKQGPRDRACEYGFRSAAAIPIVHDGSLYGVLTVYADRAGAFAAEEHEVIDQLGEVVGHAIAAVERKRALMSDEVVELEFRVWDVFTALDPSVRLEGTVSFDRVIPVGDGSYLEYGTATDDALDGLTALVDSESLPHWEALTVLGTDGDRTRFAVRLTEPPLLSTVAAHGGYVHEATIEHGDFQVCIRLPPGTDVGRVVDAVTDTYAGAEMVSKRRTARSRRSLRGVQQVLSDRLTERQQAALEAGYFAGFFEWPRRSSGEDVAASLGVNSSTFHQHLRKAENQLLDALFAD